VLVILCAALVCAGVGGRGPGRCRGCPARSNVNPASLSDIGCRAARCLCCWLTDVAALNITMQSAGSFGDASEEAKTEMMRSLCTLFTQCIERHFNAMLPVDGTPEQIAVTTHCDTMFAALLASC
jgi:hypothetical protein